MKCAQLLLRMWGLPLEQ